MEEIRALTTIDFYYLFISVFMMLIGIKAIVCLFEWVVQKFGIETKWMRKRREEHDLLIQTSKNLASLQSKHNEDVKQSIIHDKKIKDEKTANNNYLEEFQHFIGFFAQDNSQAVQVNENNCLEILKPYFDSVDQNNYSIADNAFEKFQPLFAAIAKNDNLRPYIFGEYMNNENEFTTLIDEKVKIDSKEERKREEKLY